MDQPFWGQRVADLGVGPQPIPRKRLSVERLAAAITVATTDVEMQRRAAILGERIRAEDGVAKAVEMINHYLLLR
jgi:sterol 3beta-glucosyltransferase